MVAMAYQVPAGTSDSMQVHSNGTILINVRFDNWTGFWGLSTRIPAGIESC